MVDLAKEGAQSHLSVFCLKRSMTSTNHKQERKQCNALAEGYNKSCDTFTYLLHLGG